MADLLTNDEIFFKKFEPKTQNRFIMYIDGIPAFLIRKTDRPKWSSEKMTLDHINIQRYYKGKTKWQDITIEMYDAVVPSAAQAAFEWFRLSHESVTGRDGYMDFYKKDIIINLIGPPGDKVEEWKLVGAFPISFDGGTMDWSNGGDATIATCTLSYDYAILNF